MISLKEKRPPLQVLDTVNTIKAALKNKNRTIFSKFCFVLTHLNKNMFLYSGSEEAGKLHKIVGTNLET